MLISGRRYAKKTRDFKEARSLKQRTSWPLLPPPICLITSALISGAICYADDSTNDDGMLLSISRTMDIRRAAISRFKRDFGEDIMLLKEITPFDFSEEFK